MIEIISQGEVMDKILAGTLPELRRVNIANGKQARVVRIADYPGAERPCVAKFCGGEHKGYTHEEVVGLISETVAYREELQSVGITIPINHRIHAVSYQDGSYQIVMVDEMHGDGEDLKAKLNGQYPLEQKRWIVLKILEFLNKIPNGERNDSQILCPTRVLGDFKPDNWVLDNNNIVLIDYFGPKRWGEDGLVTPYNPKMDSLLTRQAITFLCGDRRGQFSRVLAILKKQHPDVYDFAKDIGLTMLKHDHPEAYDWVKDEVDNNFEKTDMIYQVRPEFWSDKV